MNRLFVRDLCAVLLAISAVTTIALGLSRRASPRSVPVADSPGARLYETKGCIVCHTIDGSPRIGPSFLHDFGSLVTLDTGATVKMDASYIRESIREPRAKARPGYPPAMPSYDMLSDREVDALVTYIASLR